MKLFWVFLISMPFLTVKALRLPKFYKNGMVLQADPTEAIIWGFLDGNQNEVFISATCHFKDYSKKNFVKMATNLKEEDMFKMNVPGAEGMVCNFDITQEGAEKVELNDVIYGDVWICSGQSNMEWPMSDIFNAQEEIAQLADYANIRIYRLELMTSDQPENDLLEEDFKWAKSNETEYINPFSAVCLLTARYMADTLGKDKTFGLIESNWGGTKIEAWMAQEALDKCEVPPFVDDQYPWESNSKIFNAMIHPLIRTSIKGVLWYQGEANAFWNTNLYDCTFPTLIDEWRELWSLHTPSANEFPFGFMQLGPWDENDMNLFPTIRWHQTADYGLVPNDRLKNVFMGLAVDTFDQESGIHPRNKQLASKRLAYAGLNVAYNLDFPTNGPYPEVVDFALLPNGFQADVLLDQEFTWNPQESEGFYYCCADEFSLCFNSQEVWTTLPPGNVAQSGRTLSMIIPECSKALGYLWETTPVLATQGLPIYSNDDFELPAAPWIKEVAI